MSWLSVTFLSVLVFTSVNFIDKLVLEKVIKDYQGLSVFTSITGLVVGTVFWLLAGMPILDARTAFIIILTGCLNIWIVPFYFKALNDDETSIVILLFQAIPIFSLVLAFFILHETILGRQLAGFLLVLAASMAISYKRSEGRFKLSKSFFLIMVVDIGWALSGVLAKFAINATSFSSILGYESWGIGLGGFIMFLAFPWMRKAFFKDIKGVKPTQISLIFGNEALYTIAKALTFLAYSLGPVALVSAVGNASAFVGIAFGYALMFIAPKIFKEDVSAGGLTKKLVCATILLVGIILVS